MLLTSFLVVFGSLFATLVFQVHGAHNMLWFLIIALMYLSHGSFVMVSAQQPKRPFTVADDIELATFGGSSSSDEGLLFSPDGKYFVVETGRGRPGMNDVEDSLRFYRSQDIEDFLKRPSESQAPGPIWVVSRSTYKSRTIKGWRWLPNSIGAAFLRAPNVRPDTLCLAKEPVRPLFSTDQTAALKMPDGRGMSCRIGSEFQPATGGFTYSTADGTVSTALRMPSIFRGSSDSTRASRSVARHAVYSGVGRGAEVETKSLDEELDGRVVVLNNDRYEIDLHARECRRPPRNTRSRGESGDVTEWIDIRCGLTRS